MLSWHAYLLYCGVYAIAVAVPGPGVMAIIARVLGNGFRSSFPAIAGTVVGDWFLMTLSALGLAMVARAMGGLFLIVKLAGAAYLVYLAYRHWNAKVDVENELVAPATARDGFLSMLFLTIGNPKAIAFFVALLPTVVDLHTLRLPGYLQLASVTVLMIPSVLLTYAALASRFSGLVTSVRARKTINRTAAVVLAGAGVGVAVS